MPIYEYKCQACGHRLEVMQKISASPLMDCPKCGKTSLEKEISATWFQLKGTGWYATDFKNQSTEKSAEKKTTEEKSVGSIEE